MSKNQHPKRDYTPEQIERMQHMHSQERMSFAAIAREFDTEWHDIKKNLSSFDVHIEARQLKVPDYSGWDFSGMNLVER